MVCNSYGCTQLLNGVPLYMGDRMREMRTAYAHFYFSVESQQQVQQVLDLFAAGQNPIFPILEDCISEVRYDHLSFQFAPAA